MTPLHSYLEPLVAMFVFPQISLGPRTTPSSQTHLGPTDVETQIDDASHVSVHGLDTEIKALIQRIHIKLLSLRESSVTYCWAAWLLA